MGSALKNAIYIVATPIGNLGDISKRALHILSNVDKIAVEDTRHSGQLLAHLGLAKTMVALHEHNEREQAAELIKAVHDGASLALISDAGTPLISDPGYHLVRMAHEAGVTVIPIPGPSALICALSASGLPTDRFCFEGFLAAKPQARLTQLQALKNETRTMVFYESPHRIIDSVSAMLEVFGAERKITMARELTKLFETIYAGNIAELLEFIQSDSNQQRGEFVLMLAGAEPVSSNAALSPEVIKILDILIAELSVKQASSLAAKLTGVSKNLIYDYLIQNKSL